MNRAEFECRSVLGGWQTAIPGSAIVFGPVFNNLAHLWAWQRDCLYCESVQFRAWKVTK